MSCIALSLHCGSAFSVGSRNARWMQACFLDFWVSVARSEDLLASELFLHVCAPFVLKVSVGFSEYPERSMVTSALESICSVLRRVTGLSSRLQWLGECRGAMCCADRNV